MHSLTTDQLSHSAGAVLVPATRQRPDGRPAHLSPSLVSAVLEQPFPAGAGSGAVRDAAAYAASLAEIRESGHAISHEEVTGWSAVAAPVMWGDTVYGAVSVLKPSSLMPKDLALPVAATTAAAERLTLLASGGESVPYPLAG